MRGKCVALEICFTKHRMNSSKEKICVLCTFKGIGKIGTCVVIVVHEI